MKNKGLKILLCVLLVLCIIMAGALIGKEYIGDNIKEASNRNGVDVVRDTSDTEKEDDNAVDSTAQGTGSTQSDATKAEATEADTQQPQMSTIVITAPSRPAVLETITHTTMDSGDLTIREMCSTMPG